MTKLMEKAIAYMLLLDPRVQDQLAQNILEDSFADLSDAHLEYRPCQRVQQDAILERYFYDS